MDPAISPAARAATAAAVPGTSSTVASASGARPAGSATTAGSATAAGATETARATAPRHGRREQILAAAAGLFAQRGFHGVSIHDLGAAVGISGPAIYRHFPSKEAMLRDMLVGISERLLAEGRRRVRQADGPEAALAALVGWHVEFALSEPALITVQERALASLAEADQQHVRRLQRRYVETWVDVIVAVVPGADEAVARAAAHAVFGLINSTPHSALLNRDAMAALLQRMALAALTTPGALSIQVNGS
jgi:AcrR family transcriptional regulator